MKILFLCTGNSCRSQMAEAWTNHLWKPALTAWSAGVRAGTLDPLAVAVMLEAGVDIHAHYSKSIPAIASIPFEAVITLCDHARETCPVFPGAPRMLHRRFDDPPSLAARRPHPTDARAVYRRVRDEIRRFVETLPEILTVPVDRPKSLPQTGY